jgi:two-component system response regulator HydG
LKNCSDAYGKKFPGVTRRAQAELLRYPWPGNVRELENVISSPCMTVTSDFIDLADLPEHRQRRRLQIEQIDRWRSLSLDDVPKLHSSGCRTCAAVIACATHILGIGRTSFYRYLKRDEQEGDALAKSGGAAA